MRPARQTAGKVWPRGGDEREIDTTAIGIPNLAIDHICANRQPDSAEGRFYNDRRPTRVETKAFPKDQVLFSVYVDLSRGQREGEGIVQVPAVSLDEAARDQHVPLAAARAQVSNGWAVGGFGQRRVVGLEPVTCVEKLGKDRKLCSRVVSLPQVSIRVLDVAFDRQGLAGHLDGGNDEFHAWDPFMFAIRLTKTPVPTGRSIRITGFFGNAYTRNLPWLPNSPFFLSYRNPSQPSSPCRRGAGGA
jgi:hypothetical protein